MGDAPALSVRGLTRPGLEPASFEVADGEAVAIVGPSGAGKSLLLRAIADLDPSAGAVALDGADRAAMPAPAWRRRVAYLPAESGWWADDVGAHFADRDAAVAEIEPLGLPGDALGWSVARLSTGEKQRLALARLLLNGPRALLLDEPTAALDADNVERVEAVLRARLGGGLALVIVTHDERQARRFDARVMRMADGRLEAAP